MPLQVFVNGLIAAAIYGMVGLSFAIIFRPARFFHFAHAATFTWGAYLCYLMHVVLSLHFWIATVVSVIGTALLGALMELCIYRPARRRGATSIVLLLMSLGIYVVLQNIISLLFGDDTRGLRSNRSVRSLVVYDTYITNPHIWIVFSAVALFVLAWLWFKTSRLGNKMRALASDPELAALVGTNVDRVILTSFALGSAVAGAAGVLVALDTDIVPTMGLNFLMMGVITVVIGGRGNLVGTAAGALLLGLAQHIGVWKIGAEWQDPIAFAILIIFLLLSPTGFVGTPIRKAKI